MKSLKHPGAYLKYAHIYIYNIAEPGENLSAIWHHLGLESPALLRNDEREKKERCACSWKMPMSLNPS